MKTLPRIALVLLTALPMTACDLQDVVSAAAGDNIPTGYAGGYVDPLPPTPLPKPLATPTHGNDDQSGPRDLHDGQRPGPADGPQGYTRD